MMEIVVKVVLEAVRAVDPNVWLTVVPPNEVAKLGSPKSRKGPSSILLAEGVREGAENTLLVDTEHTTLLNLGNTSKLVIVGCDRLADDPGTLPAVGGSGDRQFLRIVELELDGDAKKAAEQVLSQVRSRHAGDLKRGQRNNFSETPDNFWYVIVQPRIQALSITVRGLPERFAPSTLDLKLDRPGYTRFAIRKPSEVAEAVRIIEASRRK
jgi:hypothetical protein